MTLFRVEIGNNWSKRVITHQFHIITYYTPPLSTRLRHVYVHSLSQTCDQMGARHVPELGGAVLDPASGSAQVGGPHMLIQREEGRPGLLAAEVGTRQWQTSS